MQALQKRDCIYFEMLAILNLDISKLKNTKMASISGLIFWFASNLNKA